MHAPPTRARKPDSPTLLLLLLLLSPPPHTPHPRWCAPAGCTHVNRVDRQKAGAAACGRQRAAWRQGQAVHLLGGLEAAKELGVAAADIPASDSRGPETFFDGKVFDPADPSAYLKSLSIKRVA